VQGASRRARLAGVRPRPPGAKYNENRAFRHKTVTKAGYNRTCLQGLMRQIRYSADQPNFSADQRTQTALSTEKQ
jgi:hypothetical protein